MITYTTYSYNKPSDRQLWSQTFEWTNLLIWKIDCKDRNMENENRHFGHFCDIIIIIIITFVYKEWLTIGTSSPFCMISTRFFPRGVPDCTSALRRSPVDRWVKPYFFTMRSHCVPFPDPGPPVESNDTSRDIFYFKIEE